MFVEKRKIGTNFKYYLVHSFREGKEVIKLRRYLGINLSNEELEEKRRNAENFIKEQLKHYKTIRDPFKTVLSKQELSQLKNLEKKLSFKITHLSEKQWQEFTKRFSYNTNAIEGSTLTLSDVDRVMKGEKLPEKDKNDVAEAEGVAEAIELIKKTKIAISLKLLKEIHYIVFKNTKPFAGQFRKKGIEVVIQDRFGNIVHRGAPSEQVEFLLKELIKWYEKNKNEYNPILLAAVVHNQFENIHPFQDGNGRVGRILLNNILLKHNMPPVDIEFENRQVYYLALQAYQNQGNIRPTLELIIQEYKKLRKK